MTESQTRVVHIRDNVPGAVYIGRAVGRQGIKASKWGNPFGIKRHSRGGAIFLFRQNITEFDGRPLLADLPELRGKALACWCRHDGEARTPENECHGDVLKELLDNNTNEQLREMATIVDEALIFQTHDLQVRDDQCGYRMITITNEDHEATVVLDPGVCRQLIAALYPPIAELLADHSDAEFKEMIAGAAWQLRMGTVNAR